MTNVTAVKGSRAHNDDNEVECSFGAIMGIWQANPKNATFLMLDLNSVCQGKLENHRKTFDYSELQKL